MVRMLLTESLILLAAAHCVLSATYKLSDDLTGDSFVDAFTWQTQADANSGRVNYVSYQTAKSKGLVSVNGNQVTLRADDTTVLSASGPGRDSFYLMSNKQYTTHVAVFDIAHMPTGCGTWPAVWWVESLDFSVCTTYPLYKWTFLGHELGANWPNGGEVDIVEGVNSQSPDRITLHTSAGCTMPSNRAMSGTSQGTNCDVYQTSNTACGVTVNTPDSFGPDFNDADGGWYAIERNPSFIKVFFWSRWGTVPSDVAWPGDTVDTDNWGEPAAYFPNSATCDFSTHLSAFNIMIDLDFCGTWAGNAQVYSQSKCPSTCVDYVNNNPSDFSNAYFTFNGVRIYQ